MTDKSLEKRIADIVYVYEGLRLFNNSCNQMVVDIMKEIDLDRRGINRVTPGGVEIPKSACSPDLTIAEVVTAHKGIGPGSREPFRRASVLSPAAPQSIGHGDGYFEAGIDPVVLRDHSILHEPVAEAADGWQQQAEAPRADPGGFQFRTSLPPGKWAQPNWSRRDLGPVPPEQIT